MIPDKRKTIYEDAVACWRGETMRAWKDQLVANAYKFDFPIHTPFYQLTAEQKRLLWRGNEYFHGLNDFFAYIDSERRKIQFRVMKAATRARPSVRTAAARACAKRPFTSESAAKPSPTWS